MPKFRSITMSINSQWETKRFPEFPHPDGAQYKYQGSTPSADSSEPWRPASISTSSTSTSKTSSRLTRNSSVSCYIPSIPGVRFFIKYTIEPPHPEGQLFYFKLLMNGRHISSWGVNPRTNPRGQVLRGLFAAEGKWGVTENDRTILRHGGIESRPFLFTPEVEGGSAADDGGLIEVRVFRARGRKRRAPDLEPFRPQEHYGINLPSAGLVDKPQETRFYDYILVDPKDEPYAAFLFHYRSWEHLQSLQLIPPSHPRSLLKPSNSFAFLTGPSRDEDLQKQGKAPSVDASDDDKSSNSLQDSPLGAAHISLLRKSSDIGSTNDRSRHIGGFDETFKYSLQSLEEREKQYGVPISTFSVPQATLDEWIYERPLPKLPKAKPSFDHSRNLSTSSNAPSITPSLIPWCDRDSNSPSPEPIIGVAAVVPVLRSSPLPDESVLIDDSSYSSVNYSIETTSQSPQSPRFTLDRLITPHEAPFLPPSVTVRKQKRKNANSPQGRLTIEDSDNEDNNPDNHFRGASPPPLESEWLKRQQMPSPVKMDSARIEITSRGGLTRKITKTNSDSSPQLMNKHMAWNASGNMNQQADESGGGYHGFKDSRTDPGQVVLHSTHTATYHTRNWI